MSSGRTGNPPRSAYIAARINKGRRIFKALLRAKPLANARGAITTERRNLYAPFIYMRHFYMRHL